MTEQLAAIGAAAVLAGLVGFQSLLAAGLPLGHYVWGGAHRVLPPHLPIASLVASIIYVLAALIILESAGIIDLVAAPELPRAAAWILAGLFAIGVVMNAISRSKQERIMALVAFLLSVLCVIVALRPLP